MLLFTLVYMRAYYFSISESEIESIETQLIKKTVIFDDKQIQYVHIYVIGGKEVNNQYMLYAIANETVFKIDENNEIVVDDQYWDDIGFPVIISAEKKEGDYIVKDMSYAYSVEGLPDSRFPKLLLLMADIKAGFSKSKRFINEDLSRATHDLDEM